jgi:L-ectoine synthase
MMCVFRPALTGREVHDDEGVYPLVEDPETLESIPGGSP